MGPMPRTKPWAAAALGCALAAGTAAQTPASFSGSVRLYGDVRDRSDRGPLAQARSVLPAIADVPDAEQQGDFTLKFQRGPFVASGTLAIRATSRQGAEVRGVLNELVYTPVAQDIYWSLGKKVVSWDVGYAFRPNDVVQQEARRALVPRPLEGRPVAMAEGFGSDSSWAVLVFDNRTRGADQSLYGTSEGAVAARYYTRADSTDLYAFAKWGARTQASVGGAVSWVASDAVELHASARRTGKVLGPTYVASAAPAPIQDVLGTRPRAAANQVLAGFTWTNESKVSLIAEGWYDGTAPSDAFWSRWGARSGDLLAAATSGAGALRMPAAGLLASQASALNAQALRRTNLFARLSWTKDEWQPTLDVLYTPTDRGRVVTAGVTWQSGSLRVDGGVRWYGGPSSALYGSLPIRTVGYAGLTVAF